jgi:hypothetical protein
MDMTDALEKCDNALQHVHANFDDITGAEMRLTQRLHAAACAQRTCPAVPPYLYTYIYTYMYMYIYTHTYMRLCIYCRHIAACAQYTCRTVSLYHHICT